MKKFFLVAIISLGVVFLPFVAISCQQSSEHSVPLFSTLQMSCHHPIAGTVLDNHLESTQLFYLFNIVEMLIAISMLVVFFTIGLWFFEQIIEGPFRWYIAYLHAVPLKTQQLFSSFRRFINRGLLHRRCAPIS